MSTLKRALLFIVLPALAPMLWPPATFISGILAMLVVAVLFVALGLFVWRGRSSALTLLIFTQGMNVIVRLLMFYPNSIFRGGGANILYIVTSVISIALSMYLLLRLDQGDVRVQMVT